MQVRREDHLEEAYLLCHFLGQISSFSCHFFKTLKDTGSIYWVGVQTLLRTSHEVKRWWWHPRGGSFICGSFGGKSPPFWGTFFKKVSDNPFGFSTICPSLKCLQKLDNLYNLQKGQVSQHSWSLFVNSLFFLNPTRGAVVRKCHLKT